MTEGLSGAGFDIDLRKGKAREGSLAAILRDAGPRIELKSDKICRRTGNLFIEYEQPTGASGIATTDADLWCFEFDDNCWLILPVERLRELARRAYKEGRITKGGDGNKYHGVLLPIVWLVNGKTPTE